MVNYPLVTIMRKIKSAYLDPESRSDDVSQHAYVQMHNMQVLAKDALRADVGIDLLLPLLQQTILSCAQAHSPVLLVNQRIVCY